MKSALDTAYAAPQPDVMSSTQAGITGSEAKLISIILPTYNERQNIGIITYLIDKHMNECGCATCYFY